MNTKLISWILRVAVAGEFFGHGMLAIGGKASWIAWMGTFGVSNPETAATLVFWIGMLDVALAILVLIKPIPAALLWMTLWGFWTALVRPLVGESWYDFIERFANWGAPLALYLMVKRPGRWLR